MIATRCISLPLSIVAISLWVSSALASGQLYMLKVPISVTGLAPAYNLTVTANGGGIDYNTCNATAQPVGTCTYEHRVYAINDGAYLTSSSVATASNSPDTASTNLTGYPN